MKKLFLLKFFLILISILIFFSISCRTKSSENSNDEGNGNKVYTLTERLASHKFPKLANQIQSYFAEEPVASNLSFWDLVVVDVELVENNPEYLGDSGRLRKSNPYMVILGYISPFDVIPGNTSTINGGYINGIQDDWYMKDVKGNRYKFFNTGIDWTEMLNQSTAVNSYTPDYLNNNVLSRGLLDGIFYDWIGTDWSWLNYRTNTPSGKPDVDNDGKKDSDSKINNLLNKGTQDLLVNSANDFSSDTLIMGNGGWITGPDHDPYLNGIMIENFLGGENISDNFGWGALMKSYYLHLSGCKSPNISFIMASGKQADYTFVRFALSSALMFDGYFCYTNDDGSYFSDWWYDEYSVDLATGNSNKSLNYKGYLGNPSGQAFNVDDSSQELAGILMSNYINAQKSVWRRDFENGIVLVNPTKSEKRIVLGGNYKKISGSDDPDTNDGSTISEITLKSRSGIILLK